MKLSWSNVVGLIAWQVGYYLIAEASSWNPWAAFGLGVSTAGWHMWMSPAEGTRQQSQN